jgi:hypothetical protein
MSTFKKTKTGILDAIDKFIEWLSIILMSFMLLVIYYLNELYVASNLCKCNW